MLTDLAYRIFYQMILLQFNDRADIDVMLRINFTYQLKT